MSVSWAITDNRYERKPWKRENFDGYFTDIRRAARKSLPRQPNKDLCGLLGLPLPSQRSLSTGAGPQRQSIADDLPNAPVSLKPIAIQEVNRQTDVEQQGENSGSSTLKSILLCNTSRTENCSQREKTIIGFSVYFAIIIFVLLVVVLVLSTTLSRTNENEETSGELVKTVSTSAQKMTTSTTILQTNIQTTTARIKRTVSKFTTLSKLKTSFAASGPPKTVSNSLMRVTTTTTTMGRSTVTALSKPLSSKSTTFKSISVSIEKVSSSYSSSAKPSRNVTNTKTDTITTQFTDSKSSSSSSSSASSSSSSSRQPSSSFSSSSLAPLSLSSSSIPHNSSMSTSSLTSETKARTMKPPFSASSSMLSIITTTSKTASNSTLRTASRTISNLTLNQTSKTTSHPSLKTTSLSNKKTTSSPTSRMTAKTSSNPSSRITAKTSSSPTSRITSKTSASSTSRITENTPPNPSSRITAKTNVSPISRITAKTSSNPSSRIPSKTSASPTSRITAKTSSNPSSRITSKTSASPTSRITAKTSSNPSSRITTKTASKTISKTTSNPTLSASTSQVTVNPDLFPKLAKEIVNCTSGACLAANKTLGRVDFGRSPCEDFYKFVCADWFRQQRKKIRNGGVNIPKSIPAELRQNLLLDIKDLLQRPYRDDDSFSVKLSRRLYQSCLESNGQHALQMQEIQELHKFVDALGITVDADIPVKTEAVFRTAVTMFEVSPFFKISTTSTFNDDGIYVVALKLEPTSEYLQFSAYNQTINIGEDSYLYVERLTQLLRAYITSMETGQNQQTSGKPLNSTIEYGALFEKVSRTYYVESNLSKILESTKTTADLQYITFQYSYGSMKNVFPSIDWGAVVGTHADDIPVQVINADYFHALDTFWKTLDEDDLKLFVFMSVLSKRVLTYARHPFRDVLSDIGENRSMVYTEIDCLELSLNLAREEIHALYIGQFTQRVLRNRLEVTDIKNKVNSAFQRFLSSSSWVKQGLNIAVSTMARNMKMNFSPLKSSVRQTLNITGETQTFLSLALELHKQKRMAEMTRLGTEVSEISMDWTSSQVYFDAHLNAIGLPTGLGIYLSSEDYPFDIYGYMGTLIAEKFVRVLTGRLPGGVPPQWWGTENIFAFSEVPKCFAQQLSKFQNSYYDIGNVMIMNSAVEVTNQVYQTFSSNFGRVIPGTSINENMLFAINTAQLYCQLNEGTHIFRLTKERVNNAMMNNVNFKKMFSCPDFSPMVSNDTCTLFS